MKKLLSICSVLVLGAVLQAQQQPASSTDNTTGERTQATQTNRSENRDWGWIGLFGLAGLAGLRRRTPAQIISTDRTRDIDDRGVRRTA